MLAILFILLAPMSSSLFQYFPVTKWSQSYWSESFLNEAAIVTASSPVFVSVTARQNFSKGLRGFC